MEGLEKLLKATNALGLEDKDAMDFIREERRLEREAKIEEPELKKEERQAKNDTEEREEKRRREQLEAEEKQRKFEADEKKASVSMKLRRKIASINVH